MSEELNMSEGIKHDKGKCRLELIDDSAIEGLGWVLTHGATKYGDHNWRGGMAWSRLIGAARRHLSAFAKGTDTDAESGMPHIDHAMCCLMFLSAYQKQGLGTDDRVKVLVQQRIEKVLARATAPYPTTSCSCLNGCTSCKSWNCEKL